MQVVSSVLMWIHARKLASFLALILGFMLVASEAFAREVLVLGNSITWHAPRPEVGWKGQWGMAATAVERDYVHLLEELIRKKDTGKSVSISAKNVANAERALKEEDIRQVISQYGTKSVVVLFLGDNVPDTEVKNGGFGRWYAVIAAEARRDAGVELLCVSTWWSDVGKDRVIRETCRAHGGTFVDINGLFDDPANRAKGQANATDSGVARHPGDRGMAKIAQRIFESLH